MKSMTGYGYAEAGDQTLAITAEIKSYNNRFLDIYVNLPSFLSPLEERVRSLVAQSCQRGKVEVYLRVKELASRSKVRVDLDAAKAYFQALTQLGAELKLEQSPTLGMLLGLEGVLITEREQDIEAIWALAERPLTAALTQFGESREREGAATERDILQQLERIEQARQLVASFAPGVEETIKQNIRARFAELIGDAVDENRVLAETAMLLMKYTISEELARLAAHLEEFRREARENATPGKKLDFLCQEINREVNTIGSKNQVLEVSRAVVDMKDALENIREQLRNVE